MTDNLLTVCQDIANDAGVAAPASIIGSRNNTAKRLLSAAKSAGREILAGKVYNSQGMLVSVHDWQALRKEQVFTTVADQQAYPLTGIGSIIIDNDYKRIVPSTFWDRTNDRKVRVLDASSWQVFQSGTVTAGVERFANIRGNAVLIHTTPTSADTLVFEYVSTKWIQRADDSYAEDFIADTDIPVIDDHLFYLATRWRFKQSMGMPYAEEKLEYLEYALMLQGTESGYGEVISHSEDGFIYDNIPDTGVGL